MAHFGQIRNNGAHAVSGRSFKADRIDDDALSEALRALAHADRRRFVRACLPAARTAGELAALSDLAPASVSEHLKVLRKSLLLELDVQGRFWLYRTNAAALRDVIAALASLRKAD